MYNVMFLKEIDGTWVALSVECPTLDFGSGHDLVAGEFGPCVRLRADSAEHAWDSLSSTLSLSLPLSHSHVYSLKINKL